MKNNKKIIIGVIALGIVVVLAVFIYTSRQNPAVPIISAIGKGNGTGIITGKNFTGATAVFLDPLQDGNDTSIGSKIEIPFKPVNGTTINTYSPIELNGGNHFALYVINTSGTSSPFDIDYGDASTVDTINAWFYNSIPVWTTTPTTTATFNGYSISLVKDYDRQHNGTSDIVYIQDNEGRPVFTTGPTSIFGGFLTLLPGYTRDSAQISTADDFITKTVKDITADGTSDLVFENDSGSADGGSSINHIIELGTSSSILLDLETMSGGLDLISNGTGKPISLLATDNTYFCWITNCPASPQPTAILNLDKKLHKYTIDIDLMRKPSPTHSKIMAEANGWTAYDWAGDGCGKRDTDSCVPWQYALDLMYSGNAKSARDYIDLAWKPNSQFKSEDDFLNLFASQIRSSPFYGLAPESFWGLEYLQ
jgi:hypothetical protein